MIQMTTSTFITTSLNYFLTAPNSYVIFIIVIMSFWYVTVVLGGVAFCVKKGIPANEYWFAVYIISNHY